MELFRAILVPKENQAFKEKPVRKEQLVHVAPLEFKVIQGLTVNKVLKVRRVYREQLDFLVPKVLQVQKG